jgi:regulatory protein
MELRRHLTKKRHDEKEIAAAIERLREQGYVDDREFARFWLEQRAAHKPKGEFALRSELRAKGIDARIVDELIEEGERDEAAVARQALAPRLARWSGLDARERKLKAQAFLRQRGFAFDTIEEVLASIEP